MSGAATDALRRAVELSRELKAAADKGDTQSAMRLDVERLELLKFARQKAAGAFGADERLMLQEIARIERRIARAVGTSAAQQGPRYGHGGGRPARAASRIRPPAMQSLGKPCLSHSSAMV